MLGSLIIYLKGMRRMMFQLSGFYCKPNPELASKIPVSTEARTPALALRSSRAEYIWEFPKIGDPKIVP